MISSNALPYDIPYTILTPAPELIMVVSAALMGVLLIVTGYMDQKTGKVRTLYWYPAAIYLIILVIFLQPDPADYLAVAIAILILFVSLGFGLFEGADFWALTVSIPFLCLTMGWEIALAFAIAIPILSSLYIIMHAATLTAAAAKKDPEINYGVELSKNYELAKRKEVRLIPVFAIAYWMVFLIHLILAFHL